MYRVVERNNHSYRTVFIATVPSVCLFVRRRPSLLIVTRARVSADSSSPLVNKARVRVCVCLFGKHPFQSAVYELRLFTSRKPDW